MINTQRLNNVERSDTYFKSKGTPLWGAHGSEDDRTSEGGAGVTGAGREQTDQREGANGGARCLKGNPPLGGARERGR